MIFLSPLKVSLNSLMNAALKICYFANLGSPGQADAVFSQMIFPELKAPACRGPHRMETHSWVRNEIASLWSVVSYLGSHVVPGSLVLTISCIIAPVRKKIISQFRENFGLSWQAFLFSLIMKNIQCRIHRTVIRTLRYRIWEYSFIQ